LCQLIVENKIPGFIQDTDDLDVAENAKSASQLNIRSYLGVPIRLTNGDLYGTLCCFSHSPKWDLDHQDVEVLNMFAEITAKRLESHLQKHKDNAEIEHRVQSMLDSDNLTIVYQPIYDIKHNLIGGYEALSRFHIIPGLSPDVWFNDAAKVNLTTDLETKAIKLAVQEINKFSDQIYLSINCSAETILSNKFIDALIEHPLNQIVLEITEHQSIEQYESINEALKPLRTKGLQLAVDDAGAGYASFRHILALAPEYIKVDLSIIRDIHLDLAKQSLTKAFTAFAAQTNS
jgi:EAL domain-containing protein (putative c-di-GMP-specific phosphodiesterase class I)